MSTLNDACSIEDLRKMARKRLPRGVFDFFDGGVDDAFALRTLLDFKPQPVFRADLRGD